MNASPSAARWTGFAAVFLAAVGSLSMASLNAQEPVPQEPAAQQPPPTGPASSTLAASKGFSGRSWTRYWARWTSEDTDQDVFETLSLDVGNKEVDPVTVHFMGRLAADLDGYDETFGSLSDSYGKRVDALLYDLYVDLHQLEGFSLIRAGRQSISESPEVAYFDGLHVASEEMGQAAIQAGGYVGSSTHLYESSKTGDLTAGVYLQGRPWHGGRLRLDYMHLEDRALLGNHNDDMLSASWWQKVCDQVNFDAHYTRIENRDRDARGRLSYVEAAWDMLLQASYYRLLTAQGSLVLEADPFFNSVHELYPYSQYGLLASKGLFEHLNLQAGMDLRRVEDAADVSTYNRDYDRYYFTTALRDVGVKGLTASVTADFWNSNGQLVRSWGFNIDKDFDKLNVSGGTYYSLYKFDLYSDSERDHVRTWFGKLKYKTSKDVTLDANYELEDDDYGRTHTVRMGVVWNF